MGATDRQHNKELLREPVIYVLAELGGTPTPPLTEDQCEKKKVFFLSGKGGYPPPP